MEEVSFTSSNGTTPGRGRILTGVFKSETGKARGGGVFSQFLAAGFEVFHLGTNVKISVFIREMNRFLPQVIILLCQGNITSIKKLIETIKEEGLRSMARIILYGPDIEESVRDEVHADAYAESEQELIDIVNEIVSYTSL